MLAVGDSTRLEIIFSTKRYTSRVTKRPRIETNEGPPHKRVMITSHVLARPDSTYPIIVKPYKLDISQFGEKKRDQMKFNLANVSDEELQVKLVYCSDDYFEVNLPDKLKPGQTAEAVLKLKDNVLDQSFEKSFTFELSDEPHTRFTVPVKRTVRSPQVTPRPAASSEK